MHISDICLILDAAGSKLIDFHTSHKMTYISETTFTNSVMTKVTGNQSSVVNT